MSGVESRFGKDPYRVLFTRYVAELSAARDFALAWWQELAALEMQRTGSPDEAERRMRQRWPFGPTAHPRVIAVYRKYFIACELLNEAVQREEAAEVSAEQPISEEDWGTDDTIDVEPVKSGDAKEDAFWSGIGPIDPPVFLIELLCGRHDDLAEFLAYLVFSPIGEENNRSI